MAQDLEVDLLQVAFHRTKTSNSPCCGQVPQRDSPSIQTFDRQLRSSGDLISADFDELFESQSYCFDSKHVSSFRPLCSTAGAGQDYSQSHNTTLGGELSISPYFFSDLEALAPAVSELDVSKVVLPTEDRDILEASTSKHKVHDIAEDQLHVSSCGFRAKKVVGPGRSALTDPLYNGISKVQCAEKGTDPNGALLHTSTSIATEGTKKGKKRSRVSRKPPTTVLEADSTNFRSMVQQLTGISSSPLLSNLLPQKGSTTLSFDVRGQRSQMNPPLSFFGQNVPKVHHAYTPELKSFRQSLMSKTMSGCVYGDSLSCAETPSVRHLLNELRDGSIPFELQQASAGIPHSSPLKDNIAVHPTLSTLPNGSWKRFDRASLFASIPCSTPPYTTISTPMTLERNEKGFLKKSTVDGAFRFQFE